MILKEEVATDLSGEAVAEITRALRPRPADVDDQADQIFAMADEIVERARTVDGTTIRWIGDVARL